MLDNVKALGALAGLMKNKDKLQEAGRRVRDKMERTQVVGEAGGGAARAIVSGSMRVLSVELSPALVMGMAGDAKTHQLAGSLIAEAVNNALRDAQVKVKEAMDVEAKELGLEGVLPDVTKLFS